MAQIVVCMDYQRYRTISPHYNTVLYVPKPVYFLYGTSVIATDIVSLYNYIVGYNNYI